MSAQKDHHHHPGNQNHPMTRTLPRHSPGFTLIELIVVIVMFGFLAAMLAPFIGSALTKSHEPLANLKKAASVSSDMAKLVAKYRGGNRKCDSLRDDIDDDILEFSDLIDHPLKICCFDDSNELYCDSDYPHSVNDCGEVAVYMLQVRLKQKINIGETSTFLFSCSD